MNWKALVSAVIAASLALGSCSSDDADDAQAADDGATDDAGNETADDGTTDDGTTGDDGASCSLEEPVKIVELVEIEGESNVATNDFHNGTQMAVDDINADGGICGQPIELTRIATSALDPNEAVSSFLKAQEEDPDIIIGFPNGSIVTALIGQIERAGIPVITMAGTSSGASRLDDNSSQWVWYPYLPNSVGPIVDAAADFMANELGATDIGLLTADNPTFTAAAGSFEDAIAAAGANVAVTRSYALSATDLTEQVLALQDAEGVMNWGFPNQMAVALNQQKQNGLDIPNIGPASASVIVTQGLAEGATENFYGAMICNPVDTEPEWSARYAELYPASNPTQIPASTYDSVHIFKAAVEAVGSVEADQVKTGLDEVEYAGVCSKDYFTDASGTLGHGVTIVSYAGGDATTVHTVPAQPLEVPVP